jgi:hypothetical protein
MKRAQKAMSEKKRDLKAIAKDIDSILRQRTLKGAIARLLLSLDVVLWAVLVYVFGDYWINFAP